MSRRLRCPERRDTYVGGDTREDDLLLARGLDGGAEVGVVPRVDLSVALDEGRVRVQRDDLLREGAVGTCAVVAVRRRLRGQQQEDRKSTRLNSSHSGESRMPSSA